MLAFFFTVFVKGEGEVEEEKKLDLPIDACVHRDPVTGNCWNCLDTCHKNAECIYPGKCKCLPGYIGNGIDSCNLPTPILKEIKPKAVSNKGKESITITYEIENNITVITGYCKFGQDVFIAESVTPENFICTVPITNLTTLRVAISFDNVTWSEQTAYIEIAQKGESNIKIVWEIWVFILISIIIGLIIFCIYQKKQGKDDVPYEKEERQAFNPKSSIPFKEMEEGETL